ncbi:MAG: hypothetical protein HRT45_03955 [Bdellovibrionales bacterium]|nr:hypothetical protein [Bdellovibrionales bacterium]
MNLYFKALFISALIFAFSSAWASSNHAGHLQDSEELSRVLDEFRDALGFRAKKTSVFLIGGSARSLLLSTVYKQPLRMKDFDIAIVDHESSERKVRNYSQSLKKAGFGKEKQVSEKSWVKGWGLFFNHCSSGLLVDFVSTPSLKLLMERNGLTNIERVKIEIPYNLTLTEVLAQIALASKGSVGESSFASLPFVTDPNAGLKGWLDKKIELVLKDELAEVPTTTAMRLIRMHFRLGAEFGSELQQELKSHIASENLGDQLGRATRHFTYFFDDEALGAELKLANELGIINKLAPSASRLIDSLSVRQIEQMVFTDTGPAPWSDEALRTTRFKKFLSHLSEEDQNLFTRQLVGFYPELDSIPEN